MNKKNFLLNTSLWWVDFNILNLNALLFKFSKINNIYFLNINYEFFFFFFLLNSKNLNTLNFYILDILTYKTKNINNYFLSYQSVFFDFKILLETNFLNSISSISNIYKGALWVERETKEFNGVQYTNLNDTRKLLLNYNYNNQLQYNNFNHIINDLKI